MPRVTLFRVVAIPLFSVWLLLAVWFATPVPSALSGIQRENYISSRLKSGSELTTVIEADHQWLDAQNENEFNHWWHNAAIVRWQLANHAETNSIFLKFGFETSLNLTDFASKPEASLSLPINITLSTSDQDGVCPPYFDYADATLLNHIISPNNYQELSIRVLTAGPGEVKLWKHRHGWENFHQLQDIDATDESVALLAVFSGVLEASSANDLSKLAIRRVSGHVSTSTLIFRKAVVLILAPLVVVWDFVIAPTIEYVAIAIMIQIKVTIVIGALLVFCFAVTKRRTESFYEWTQRYWMTRWYHDYVGTERKAVIWGTLGPIEKDDEEEEEVIFRHATPLRGPFDFFRSSSPLDDLLVTFQSTAWMIQPIDSHRRRARQVANADSSLKHRYPAV